MLASGSRGTRHASLLTCIVAILAIAIGGASFVGAAEQNIDLDGNPANGDESRLETNVLQSYPVKIENVIFNNAADETFTFIWPGAGPGGFDAFVTPGPDVGIKWEWTTLSQVYSIQAPIEFVPAGEDDPRGIGVFGAPPPTVQLPAEPRTFIAPGKSIFPTQVTLSSATLTSSLITFFSPEQTLATCESTFVPGRFEQTVSNRTSLPITINVQQRDCCPHPGMTICEDGCQDYLTDVNNCGGCDIACNSDEYCDEGSCQPICEPGQILCGEVCVDALGDEANCGGCGIACAADEFCDGGACAPICPGETLCGEVCVDTLTDEANCGGCDVACAVDEFCDGGSCEPICPGETYCDGACVDTTNDPDNCGSCGNACGPLYVCANGVCEADCPAGQILCGDTCVDPLTDDDACGGCGVVCAEDEFCDGGSCAPICPGQTWCGGDCVDIDSDPLNCGACGNVCGENEICEAGACHECRPPRPDACNNVCTNTHTDGFNCGACGNVCDFTGCPSGGQGTCSQGMSCVCTPGAASTLSRDPATALLFPPESTRRLEARDAPTAEPARPRTRTGARRAGAAAVVGRTTLREDAATTRTAVVEAPVCDVTDLETVLQPGESLTRCFSGAVTGKEVFTRATVTQNGDTIGQGPCAVVVPDTDTPPAPFIPAITSIQVLDESGDGLCQPGEAWCELLISVVNLGTEPFPPSTATISVPTDPFNPNGVDVLSATVQFDAFPAFDQIADCDNEPNLDPIEGQQTFRISLPAEQESDVARPFLITFDAGGTTVDMPFVLGIGRSCDPTDLDGENYDRVRGFLSPVDAALVPAGAPVNFSTGNFNQGGTLPLKMRIYCGDVLLNRDALVPEPQIVAIVNTVTGPIQLVDINAGNNANPNDPFFDCGSQRCEFNLFTDNLVPGDYVIRVAMPDTRVYEAGITIRP